MYFKVGCKILWAFSVLKANGKIINAVNLLAIVRTG